MTLVTTAFEESMGFLAITTDELFFISGGQGMTHVYTPDRSPFPPTGTPGGSGATGKS